MSYAAADYANTEVSESNYEGTNSSTQAERYSRLMLMLERGYIDPQSGSSVRRLRRPIWI